MDGKTKEQRQADDERELRFQEEIRLTDKRVSLISNAAYYARIVEEKDRRRSRPTIAEREYWSNFYALISAEQVYEMACEIERLRDAFRQFRLIGGSGVFMVQGESGEVEHVTCPVCEKRKEVAEAVLSRIPESDIQMPVEE